VSDPTPPDDPDDMSFNDGLQHPDLAGSNDPRWVLAEFGAKVQALFDDMTPPGFEEPRVSAWMLVAEVTSSDGSAQIATVPYDRFAVAQLVGMLDLARELTIPRGY